MEIPRLGCVWTGSMREGISPIPKSKAKSVVLSPEGWNGHGAVRAATSLERSRSAWTSGSGPHELTPSNRGHSPDEVRYRRLNRQVAPAPTRPRISRTCAA